MIVVKVRDREIRVAPTAPVTSGSVGLPVTWTFSEEWEGLTKTAVFRGSDTARDVVLTEDACVVPADVLEESGGPLEIGVRGVKITHDEDADEDIVTVVIPTIWGRIDRIYDGTIPSEADPSVPEPDWTEQVKAAAAEALLVAQGVRQDADDGVFDGASAYEQAVAGGYDGTEAEFNADLAGFSEKEQAAMSAAEAAAQSAQNAANSASTAATKSGEAAQSAATASTHKDAASSSAQSAANSATSAGNSASAAAASASAANSSATSASTSESNAANSATNAAASETAAAASESAAAASATAASNSAAAAAQSASAIEEYEHDAEAWAIGKRGGTDVDTSDETYQNNAKYYAEQAAASSSSASSAASAAAQSATDAASEAASSQSYSRSSYISSTMASGSATAAAEAQTAAETAASTAEGHATKAASSATAASGSATAAAQSATEAGNASTAATTAKEAAEDAQEAAETAAQSIAQSAAQIDQNKQDVSDLKSATTYTEKRLTALDGEIILPTFEHGSVYANNGVLEYSNHSRRIRMKRGEYIELIAGDEITVTGSGYIVGYNYSTDDGATYVWGGSIGVSLTVQYDGRYVLFIQAPTDITDIESTKSHASIHRIANLKTQTDTNTEAITNIENTMFEEAILPTPVKAWIRYSNGQSVTSSAVNTYIFNNDLPKYISAFLTSDSDVLCAIAFYNKKYTAGDTISSDTTTNGYMSSYSVDFLSGNHDQGAWYKANVPEGCKTVIITTKKPSETVATAQILFNSTVVIRQEITKKISEINDSIFGEGWKYIYHFGMSAVSDRNVVPVIPSQSVFDIVNANNLGYKCIEANVHKTSDSKYVVTHGIQGNLGHDFDTLDGEDAYGTSISGNTLQYLQNNFRYRSSVEEYRVPITTLEEFLHQAKQYNMIVMAQYVDVTELNIIKGIMGTRFFMYVAPRNMYDGPILEYLSYTTKSEILARCNTVGRPFIYSMANPGSFSDNDLQDIIDTLHQNGFYIATAYQSSSNITKLSKMGFDFFAVGENNVTNYVILDGKRLIFNQDGSVSWVMAEI